MEQNTIAQIDVESGKLMEQKAAIPIPETDQIPPQQWTEYYRQNFDIKEEPGKHLFRNERP